MNEELLALERIRENLEIEGCLDGLNEKRITTIKQALTTKSKKEQAFDKIQSIIDTWATSGLIGDEYALKEIDNVIREVLNNE